MRQEMHVKSSGLESSTAASGTSVMEALARQHFTALPDHEQRRHKRHRWVTEICIHIEEQRPTGINVRDVRVTTRDLSAGGFCFIHHQMIHAGTRIRARFDSLPDAPMLSGTVSHCRHIGGTKHEVGVQFD